MQIFKTYFMEQTQVGITEPIQINGIGEVIAKIDSGNQGYNVLHGTNIEHIDGNKIKFLTIDNKTVSFEKRGFINIHAGQQDETRPVISLSFKMQDRFYENVPFSITDRSKNEQPVLIGEPFLKKINAIINVNKETLSESFDSLKRYQQLEKLLQQFKVELEGEYNGDNITQTPRYFEILKAIKELETRMSYIKKALPKDKIAQGFKMIRDAIK